MGERGVGFTDVYNFRDLGGYPAADGQHVAWHRLYRSDDLARLSDADKEAFAALGIRTVIDLRRPNEVDELGRFPQTDGVDYHHIHLRHPAWPSHEFTDTAARTSFVVERYREMSIASADGFGTALRLIADAGTAPLVFHCIAGKDRTGVLAALTLSLLGVDDDTVADDYQLSEAAEPQAWARWKSRKPAILPRPENVTVSPRDAMLHFLTDLRDRHGSVAGYVASVGVTEAHLTALRDHLLDR
jgi:protein-tyrosine phosphatase